MTAERDEFLAKVLRMISNNPTAGDLDELLEAYGRVGFLAADAEGQAEEAEAERKYHAANEYLSAKRGGEKVTEREAEAMAELAIREYRDAEVVAFTKAKKLKNLLLGIEQVINGIKYLGRLT